MFKNFFEELIVWSFGWIPTAIGRKIRAVVYRPLFKHAGSFSIDAGVYIKGFKNIELKNHTNIGRDVYLYAHDEGTLSIGENVSISAGTMINAAFGTIILGDDVLIGPKGVMRAANHRMDDMEKPINQQGHLRGEIIIEKNVWLGANVTILPNVILASGTVVGAGAVVTKNSTTNTIIGGVPAKLIKYRGEKSE